MKLECGCMRAGYKGKMYDWICAEHLDHILRLEGLDTVEETV